MIHLHDLPFGEHRKIAAGSVVVKIEEILVRPLKFNRLLCLLAYVLDKQPNLFADSEATNIVCTFPVITPDVQDRAHISLTIPRGSEQTRKHRLREGKHLQHRLPDRVLAYDPAGDNFHCAIPVGDLLILVDEQ